MENDMNMQKVTAEIRHLNAMSDKLIAETRWYPIVVSSALVAAVITLTKLFL